MTEKSEYLAEKPNQQPDELVQRGDILSEVLDIVHVRGEQALMIAPEGPQTISFPNAVPCVHIVEHGEITIHVAGEPEPFNVGANQLALLLKGQSHHVDYGTGGKITQIDTVIEKINSPNVLQFGVGNTTRCFWGSFSVYGDLAESVLRGMPHVAVELCHPF